MIKILKQFPFIRNLLIGIRHRFWSIKTKKSLNAYLLESNIPKLQLGAGQNLLKGWFNTDYFPRKNISFVDVTKPFPMPSGIFNFVFTEHHIEHISYKNAVFMLKESFRVLKPGGLIKIVTPDLKNSLNFYFNNDINNGAFSNHANEFLCSGFYNAINYIPIDDYIKAHEINDMFYNYEHKFIYDFESLKRILEHAGFINIKNCSQEKSIHEEFTNIESHASDYDIYFALSVEAEK